MWCGKQSFVGRLGLGMVVVASLLARVVSAEGREEKKKLSDAEITKLLVGKWSMETNLQDLDPKYKARKEFDVKMKMDWNYKKDGTFTWEITGVAETTTVKGISSGTWKVADGTIEIVLTEVKMPAYPKLKVGDKGQNRVVVLNDTTLTVVPIVDGKPDKEMTFKRVK